MYPRRLLIALGLAGLVSGLLAGLPARLVLDRLPLAAAGVVAERVEGTLWDARAHLQTPAAAFDLAWQVRPLQLLLGRVAADLQLSAKGLEAEGALTSGVGGHHLAVSRAHLDADLLGRLLAAQGVTPDQPLQVAGLAITLATDRTVTAASGRAAWGPGQVRLRNRAEPLAMPALRALLSATDGKLVAVVDSEREPGAELVRLELAPATRGMHLVVRQRAADLAGLPSAGRQPPDTALLEMRQGN